MRHIWKMTKLSNLKKKLVDGIKSSKSVLAISITGAIVYSFVLGITGLYGDTVQSALIYFVKNILPYLGIAFGYFLVIFIPIRVMQAKERNRQELNNYINEQKLQEHTDNEKELQQKILEALTKEETI